MTQRLPAQAALAFGDVVQIGTRKPYNTELAWGSLDVVQGLDITQTPEPPRFIQVFPVINNAEGIPFLERPVTRWGTDVRIFGCLSLGEVRSMFRPYADPAARMADLIAYTSGATPTPQLRTYTFRPHNETGRRSASYRWI